MAQVDPKTLELYLVTHRYDYSEEEFLSRIEEALKAGVTMVQLREKTASTGEIYAIGQKVQKLTKKYGVPLLVDDRVDVALALDADGVHIGDDEMPVDVTRRLIGPDKILGVSADSVERAKEAAEQGADYFGIGSIFPTPSKPDARVVALDTVKAITDLHLVPAVAIGGIKEDNLDTLKGSGIDGVSIISEIMTAENTTEKVQALLKKLEADILA